MDIQARLEVVYMKLHESYDIASDMKFHVKGRLHSKVSNVY